MQVGTVLKLAFHLHKLEYSSLDTSPKRSCNVTKYVRTVPLLHQVSSRRYFAQSLHQNI